MKTPKTAGTKYQVYEIQYYVTINGILVLTVWDFSLTQRKLILIVSNLFFMFFQTTKCVRNQTTCTSLFDLHYLVNKTQDVELKLATLQRMNLWRIQSMCRQKDKYEMKTNYVTFFRSVSEVKSINMRYLPKLTIIIFYGQHEICEKSLVL